MRMLRSTVFLALLLATVGCKKSMAESAMPPDYGGAQGAVAEAEPTAAPGYEVEGLAMDEEADMDAPVLSSRSDAAIDPAPAPARERRVARMEAKKARRQGKSEPSTTVASPAPATTKSPGPAEASTGEPAVEEPKQDLDTRLIIYSATLTISVFNLEEAIAKAEELPETLGGYVHSMQGGQLVLRVPAKKLREALSALADFGVVEHRALTAQDVSAEYVDMESRVRALESTQKQLLELMSKARTVEEALHVRQALDSVTAELEVLKGRMRHYDNLVAFSTITLTLMERGPHTPVPSSNDPFPWVDNLGVEATEWK